MGTAGLRIASNGDQVVAAIQARTGVLVEVISGEEEGRLAYVAAKAGLGMNEGSLVVFDTGGGSSQFTFGHDASVDERFSVDVGAVRYTERYRLDHAVSPEVLRDAMAAISADLSRIEGRPIPDALVAMGGAVTNITAVRHGSPPMTPRSFRARSSTARRSIARSSSTGRRMPTRAAPSSACSQSGRKSSSPVPALSAPSWKSWASRASPSATAACATVCWPSVSELDGHVAPRAEGPAEQDELFTS